MQADQQLVFADDDTPILQLFLTYQGFVSHQGHDRYQFWIKINGHELAHTELLDGMCDQCDRLISSYAVTSVASSIPFASIDHNADGSVDDSGCPQLTTTQLHLFDHTRQGDTILPWDVEIAFKDATNNQWDNNNRQNFRFHYDANSISHPHVAKPN
jgi:hypothetical protein